MIESIPYLEENDLITVDNGDGKKLQALFKGVKDDKVQVQICSNKGEELNPVIEVDHSQVHSVLNCG